MLSRLAESFYWIGRYVERAEASARLLAEHHQRSSKTSGSRRSAAPRRCWKRLRCRSARRSRRPSWCGSSWAAPRILDGQRRRPRRAGERTRHPGRAVRRRLRGAQQRRHAAVVGRQQTRHPLPGVLLHGVLERLAVVHGVIDWTSPRDEGYLFLRLGRTLERIDMTARLLAVHHEQLWPESGPVAILRATAGLHAFLRGRNPMNGEQVRGFLVLDPLFPDRCSARRGSRKRRCEPSRCRVRMTPRAACCAPSGSCAVRWSSHRRRRIRRRSTTWPTTD